MIILDTLLIGGLKFVFNKIAEAVDAQLNDDAVLREELLAAQMRLELGEITEQEFAAIEGELLARIREIRERARGEAPAAGELKITGIEATFGGDDDDARRQ
ncbi:MAG TPA: gas vesicle protein GvpG [Methylomirabilota bacterium]|nr:gas vesicle protein GvpG [Methylomirabilota bacterium]HEV8615066.1 gas vesicle protein GvpG [Methylomirabilota bacterium]